MEKKIVEFRTTDKELQRQVMNAVTSANLFAMLSYEEKFNWKKFKFEKVYLVNIYNNN